MTHENMTVGWLKKFIEENNIPDDAIIYTERVTDVYYEKHGWDKTSVFKEGYWYHQDLKLIRKAKSGEFNNKEKYPRMTQEKIDKILEMEQYLDESKVQYHPIYSPVKYKDDNNLYLDLHY